MYNFYALCLVTQSCPTLCDTMDCSPPGSSVHGDSPGKNTGMGCHALLQRIFPTQGPNPGLLRCRRILYQLRYQGSFVPLPWGSGILGLGDTELQVKPKVKDAYAPIPLLKLREETALQDCLNTIEAVTAE